MGLELDVYAGEAPNGTKLATLTDATDKSCAISLHEAGVGSFTIPRSSAQATASIIRQGNLVKVRLTEVSASPIFGFYMDVGRFDLVSMGEEGAETLTFGGKGVRSYLGRAIMWNATYLTGGTGPTAGVWALGNAKAGAILYRIVSEAMSLTRPQRPLPDLSLSFTAAYSSAGGRTPEAWLDTPQTATWTADVGEYLDVVIDRLLVDVEPMVIWMEPNLTLNAVNSWGSDRTSTGFASGKVRLAKGVNIATALTRELADSRAKSHALVAGDSGTYATVVDFDPLAFRLGYDVRETFVTGKGTGTSSLQAFGAKDLAERKRNADALRLGIPFGDDALNGIYLPGPPAYSGHYWVGDTITVHTGNGAHDYSNSPQRIVELALGEDEAGGVLVEATFGSTYSGRSLAQIRDAIKGTDRR
ncbi:MAG: hypothetical protein WAN48_11405 [Actinomycetes bacterium]